jgi:hypothetical protein
MVWMQSPPDKKEQYKVCYVVDQQDKMRVVGARWVYTCKLDGTTGLSLTHKACWVTKGFSHIAGIDYSDFLQ